MPSLFAGANQETTIAFHFPAADGGTFPTVPLGADAGGRGEGTHVVRMQTGLVYRIRDIKRGSVSSIMVALSWGMHDAGAASCFLFDPAFGAVSSAEGAGSGVCLGLLV
eukprot:CAMPEP_0172040074 /NCGR_PEP_ID=MMETSP1041-20130122/24282_1 /TAXON_ID=464988 /ORGANISM="Hemiselmis andersenii, Strain CCMP439" /LENGTH=108 /DNA_ID=CAMNT_0012697903 /DNA_START=97 /DNA_END=423 /DNA_ORIENTATION=-